ncbi:hypothetical protein GCM10023210_31010 [Chryseobacterium ginsengisoli]|uniref:Uncharacterized protein n=1 Tax=Chryseobacterium ginsengisoli TaxID=363853 RepID=A0ABP9MMZ7_9FLAO
MSTANFNEMFPPTEQELKKMIAGLKARLEDDSYQSEWVKINDELIKCELLLKNLK